MADSDGVDALLLSLGKWGRWQLLQCLWLSLTYIPLAFQYVCIVFIGHQPKPICPSGNDTAEWTTLRGPENETPQESYRYGDAITWNYSTPCEYGSNLECTTAVISIASEWNLVCGSAYLVQLSQTILSVGMAFGHLILPVTDRFGRKRSLVVSHAILLVASFVTAVSPNFVVFCLIRFIIGCLFPVVNIAHCVLELELFPAQQRATVAMSCKFVWASAIMLLTLVAYIFRNSNWRYLQLVLSVPSVLVILQMWLIDESIRWLFVMNKVNDAVRVLKKAAKMNRISYQILSGSIQNCITERHHSYPAEETGENKARMKPLLQKLEPVTEKTIFTGSETLDRMPDDHTNGTRKCNSCSETEYGFASDNMQTESGRFLHQGDDTDKRTVPPPTLSPRSITFGDKLLQVFKHKTLRKYVAICTCMLTVDVMLYYGLLLISPSLAGDRFVNMMLNGAVEIPGYILCILTLNRFNRKTCILGFHIFSGTALLIATIIDTTKGPPLLVTALATLGKLGSSGTLMITFLYSSEILPTNIRGIGTDLMGVVANVGALLAPFSSYMGDIGVWIPGSILSLCCFTVCFLLVFVPETRGRQLPQTVEDLDKWTNDASREEAVDRS